MMTVRNSICRPALVLGALVLGPALLADGTSAIFTNSTEMVLTLSMAVGAVDGLKVKVAFDGGNATFTGGQQGQATLHVPAGAVATFSLEAGVGNGGTMPFRVQAPAGQRLDGDGEDFIITYETAYQDGAQKTRLWTGLSEDQELLRGSSPYPVFQAKEEDGKGLTITQHGPANVQDREAPHSPLIEPETLAAGEAAGGDADQKAVANEMAAEARAIGEAYAARAAALEAALKAADDPGQVEGQMPVAAEAAPVQPALAGQADPPSDDVITPIEF